MQYSAVVKNLLKFDESGKSKNASYVTTGLWGKQSITEAKKMFPEDSPPIEVATGIKSNYREISDPATWTIDKDTSYIHYCQNETVHGFQFGDEENNQFPHKAVEGMAVVCDMSSDIGSRKLDFKNFGMIYAGA
jgi:phosphoserine aminotransferase